MGRIWIELLTDKVTSEDHTEVVTALRTIAEDDTGDATLMELTLAQMILNIWNEPFEDLSC